MSQNELLSVIEYLGGKKLLGIKAPSKAFAFHSIVSLGLPAGCVVRFKQLSGFSNIEISALLGVSEKTFIRWQQSPRKPIDPVASDRLYRTAKIMALADTVLEGADEAHAWMNEPQFGLNNRIPRELLSTDAGAREVEDLLLRMEHGYLA